MKSTFRCKVTFTQNSGKRDKLYIICDGACIDPCACYFDMGEICGYCGNYQCDGTCNDPCNNCVSDAWSGCDLMWASGAAWSWTCGTIQCDGTCVDSMSPCCGPWAGYSCGSCGVWQCDGSCTDPCQMAVGKKGH